jgi:hypothetical protein
MVQGQFILQETSSFGYFINVIFKTENATSGSEVVSESNFSSKMIKIKKKNHGGKTITKNNKLYLHISCRDA